LLAAVALLFAIGTGKTARTHAQSGTVTITTDQAQYNVGDVAQVCYTVAGPGPVTISDHLADGTTQVIVSNNDTGTGDCFTATVTAPAGKECLQISDTSGDTTGTAQTCFQVLAGTGSATPSAQDCGEVDILGGHVTSSGAPGIENCFYHSYQGCNPATLEVSVSGVDAGIRHTFGLLFSGGFCAISDAQQHFVVPRPPQPAINTVCTGLSQTPDGGLLFSNCGGSDVMVPAQ
jgi:hypothetical protein